MKFCTLLSTFFTVALTFGVTTAKSHDDDDEFLPDVRRVPMKTFTLQAPFLHDSLHSRWYDFGGDTLVRTDKYVRLTSDRPGQIGFLSSRLPLTAVNFEIIFEFKISGKGNLYGDGMAVWLTKDRSASGPVFGGPDNFEGLGIFIDTYKNNRPGVTFPYIMLMHGDGHTSYSKSDDGKSNEIAGCSARGLHNANQDTRMRITYVKGDFLRVDLQYKEPEKWTQCFRISNPPDLPQTAYLSFSAETGELSENHDINEVEVNMLVATNAELHGQPLTKLTSPPSVVQKKKSGSWFWFFVKLGLLGTAAYFGYKKYLQYQKEKKYSRDAMF
ncbi:legume-like lectin family-domain-containing protein [Kockiozyma suomiensis]|uniref:legume-like lectin family-domain-containing protein n=1 Tax=Kockiozyma suomiensis TaxID=1337062 RepID=UPI0033442987